MTINDPLDLQVSLADQQPASRLGLASIDNDSDRYRQALAEIVAGGMPTALAVISVLNQLLASGMATSMGVEASRAVFERTILDAGAASDELTPKHPL